MNRVNYVFLLGFLLFVCTASAEREQPKKYSAALRNYSSAFEYMKQGNYEKARDLLNQAIEDSSTYVDAYIALRKVHMVLGETDKAIEICMEGLSCVLNGLGKELEAALELDAMEEVEGEKGLESLEELGEKLEEKIAEAARKLTLALADLYAKTGEPEKANELFTGIIDEAPDDANSYDLYASYLQSRGRVTEAIEHFEKAYQIDPENKGIAFRLGDAYFAVKHYQDAAELFSKVREDFPGDIDIMKKLAESYYNICEYEKAIEEYKAIIELIPKHVSSRIKIGNAYKELKKYDSSKKYYLEALEIEPNNLSVYYQLINLEISRKNLTRVKKYLDEAFKINLNDHILLALYGEYYYRLGLGKMSNKEWNTSIEMYEKAIEIWNKTIQKSYDPEWKEYARKGIERAKKMIEEVKKVRW